MTDTALDHVRWDPAATGFCDPADALEQRIEVPLDDDLYPVTERIPA